MAKIYGGRWRISDGSILGRGGQSEVFKVLDVSGELSGEFALKRVLNPARRQRFHHEIEAIKRLDHPRIIKLIDHSLLDGESADTQKQYIVMPIAAGGDLSDTGRLSGFKDSIELALHVAKQIAEALVVAHAQGVIHRDIKPQNVLFVGFGHDIWLADFGVCLLRDSDRATDTGEVVGPRAFMAPELEAGGRLDVTPAADIYSLGKLIYFMVSGGTLVPRENINEEPYKNIFDNGERYHFLGILLSKMICPLSSRLKEMSDVVREIDRILDWGKTAHQSSISQKAISGIHAMQRAILEKEKISQENTEARRQEGETLETVAESVISWMKGELDKVSAAIGGDVLGCEVKLLGSSGGSMFIAPLGHNTAARGVNGIEISLLGNAKGLPVRHVLKFILCRDFRQVVRVISNDEPELPVPVRDIDLRLVPCYEQVTGRDSRVGLSGFLTQQQFITSPIGGGGRGTRGGTVTRSYVSLRFSIEYSQSLKFSASEWPGVADKINKLIEEAVEVYVEFIQGGAKGISE